MEENVKAEEEVTQTIEAEEAEQTAAQDAAGEIEEESGELAQALAQVEEYKAALQRERADFQNYRKRIEREMDTLRTKVSGDVLAKVLPVVDDFERALGAVPEAEKQSDWMAGINLIHRKLQNLMDAEGVKIIDPLGEPFDPNFHEAIGADEATEEYNSGHITAVLQKGYVKGDTVLRPAMVRVAN